MRTAPPTMRTQSVAAACLAVAGALVAAAVIGDQLILAASFSSPGAVTLGLGAVVTVGAVGSGSIVIGSLLFALFLAPNAGPERVGPAAFRALETARRWSLPWLVGAAVATPFQTAASIGRPVGDFVSADRLLVAIGVSGQAKGSLVGVVLVACVTIGVRLTLRWTSTLALWCVSVIALLAPMVAGNAGQGVDHDLATSAVVVHATAAACWVGVLWSTVVYLRSAGTRGAGVQPSFLRRLGLVTACGAVAVTVSGLELAWTLTGGAVGGFHYSWVVLAKVAVAAVAVPACLLLTRRCLRKDGRARIAGLLTIQLLCLAAAFGASVGLAQQPTPTVLNNDNENALLIGYDLPSPPTFLRLLTVWRFDLVLGTTAVLLAVGYIVGLVRLRRRGIAWPGYRTLAWMMGCALLLVSTSSGVGAYSEAMFSIHMVVHMSLNMFVPILLVLGAPVLMALRVFPAAPKGHSGPREWTVWLMHARFTRVLTNPLVAIPIYVVSLYGLYFTPVLPVLLQYHWGHLLMDVHFLVTGYLYYWSIIGVDPGPRRLPYIARVGVLFAIMPFHAFFGVIIMNEHTLLAPDFYQWLTLPWLADQLADQSLGGAIAWISGEIPLLIVVFALCSQWYKADERAAGRITRSGEEELEAYNAMLEKLSHMRE